MNSVKGSLADVEARVAALEGAVDPAALAALKASVDTLVADVAALKAGDIDMGDLPPII